MNIAIVYHKADFDGLLSNEICQHFLQKRYPNANVFSCGWDYGLPLLRPIYFTSETVEEWGDFDEIFIVDLSVKELMEDESLKSKITWIDHHKSAIDYFDTNFRGTRIIDVAACRLCYQYFTSSGFKKEDFVNREVVEPLLITLAGEYDIFDLRDSNCEFLQFGLNSLTHREFQNLVFVQLNFTSGSDDFLRETICNGVVIKKYSDKINREYALNHFHKIHWEGLEFCVLNSSLKGSGVFNALDEAFDACFSWRHNGKTGRVNVSLYHNPQKKNIDLSLIAQKYGGGGHKGACGFTMSLDDLAKIFSKQ